MGSQQAGSDEETSQPQGGVPCSALAAAVPWRVGGGRRRALEQGGGGDRQAAPLIPLRRRQRPSPSLFRARWQACDALATGLQAVLLQLRERLTEAESELGLNGRGKQRRDEAGSAHAVPEAKGGERLRAMGRAEASGPEEACVDGLGLKAQPAPG